MGQQELVSVRYSVRAGDPSWVGGGERVIAYDVAVDCPSGDCSGTVTFPEPLEVGTTYCSGGRRIGFTPHLHEPDRPTSQCSLCGIVVRMTTLVARELTSRERVEEDFLASGMLKRGG